MDDIRLQELQTISDKIMKEWEEQNPVPTDEVEMYELIKNINKNILDAVAKFMYEYEKSKK